MSSFIVEGGHALHGEISINGAKNEALEVVCATLLTSDKVTITNLPEISDVRNLIAMLADMGVKVHYITPRECEFQADSINLDYLKSEKYSKKAASLRGSVMILGPLLARYGEALMPKPGGDKIGRRRMDTHFVGFSKLGAQVEYNQEYRTYQVSAKNGLRGTYMLLDEASVTGTANILMAAVLAKGKTVIYNAACEPYIQQLCRMLVGMGARISGIGSNLLEIEGVSELHGTTHRLLPDMIEVGSFVGMAAMTGSNLLLKDVGVRDLGMMPEAFARLGVSMEIEDDNIRVNQKEIYGIDQFESRLFFVDKLLDMGARIILCDPHRAVVIGAGKFHCLRATDMVSPDIRAGIAMLIAAMGAKGTSRIQNINQIDRGYANIDGRLNKLGAKIIRIEE